MFAYIPAVIVSGLMHVLAPNVTDYASAATLAVTLTIRDFELAQSLYTYHLPTPPSLPTLSTLHSLSGYALTEAERGLDLTSPTDLVYYTAPIGAYAWDSSPTLRSYTHAAFSFARDTSSTACGAASEALHASLDFIIPGPTPRSTGYPSLSDTAPYPIFNVTSISHEPPRPVFGPEWEWTPRDLVVYVPQPSCPVPQLTPDMSTASGLGRCGLGPERYTPMDVAAFPLPPLPIPGSLDLFDALEALDMLGWITSPHPPRPANPIDTLVWLSMGLAMLYLVRLARYYLVALVIFGQACACLCGRLFRSYSKCDEKQNADQVPAADKDRLDTPDPASDPLDAPNLNFSVAFSELPATQIVITEAVCDPTTSNSTGIDNEQAETSSPEQAPATTVLEKSSQAIVDICAEGVGLAMVELPVDKVVEEVVEKPAQEPVEKIHAIAHDSRDNREPLESLLQRPVVRVEEDIFESTLALVTALARQKREDRRQDRVQRAAAKTSPPSNVNEAISDTSRNTTSTNKKDREGQQVGAGGARYGGGNQAGRTRGRGVLNGGSEVGSVRKSSLPTECESSQDRRWAGKDVGMLHVGFVGDVLVLEGAMLKGGRRQRK